MNFYAYAADSPTNLVDPRGTSNSLVHYQVTVEAAEASGMSWADAQAWALAVMLADFIPGSQGTGMRNTALHSMAGRKDNGNMESCQEAYQQAANFINQIDNSGTTIAQLALALHSIEDSYSPAHQYRPWNGNLTMNHVEGDAVTPNGDEAAAEQFLRDLANGQLGPAENYLNPSSVCN